ncbi:transporter [Homoserinimonas sp. OAct 916]|uniref:transporter n=1 Tax=Homoserinimonas sp. OAct 916 TaxID=2211450 RepID=UPI000DBE4189|nr:transporter [Homoserinimonas sp. OAct 916]
MVAHLVRLRLLLLVNSWRRSPWQLVAVVLGAAYGLGMLGLITVGMVALGGTDTLFIRTVLVLAGSALVIGWMVGPLITVGIDQTLDPARLAPFPLTKSQVLAGITVGGVLGIPGILTLLATGAIMVAWWQHPAAAVAALVCAVVGTLSCVIGARTVAAMTTGLVSGRRFREISGVLLFIPLVLLGPIIIVLGTGVRGAVDALPQVAAGLGWTPLGAVWSVPAQIALGNHPVAALQFAIALAWPVLLVLVWRRSLDHALSSPTHGASRRVARGALGFFRLLPDTATGAVAARSLTYWVRDPRYGKQLILVPIIPVLLYFYASTADSPGLVNAAGPVIAFLLSLSIFTDVSYDGTAFALHLSTGIRGRADRSGRILAVALFAVPIVIAVTVGSAWLSNSWLHLPGLLGLTLGILLTGFGVASITSARIVFPVPAAGDSPFKSPPGAGLISSLTTFATWGILLVLIVPEMVLAIIGFTLQSQTFGWITLAVGVVLGGGVLLAGIRIGGALLERRGPELLQQLARQG